MLRHESVGTVGISVAPLLWDMRVAPRIGRNGRRQRSTTVADIRVALRIGRLGGDLIVAPIGCAGRPRNGTDLAARGTERIWPLEERNGSGRSRNGTDLAPILREREFI